MNEELGEITKCYTMTFRRRSKHSPERFWRALTQPDEVAKWMEAPAKIDLRVGGDWFIDFAAASDASYSERIEGTEDPLDGIIVRVEPERVLAFVWGWSVVEWTIEPADDGCTYIFVHNGCADRGEGEEGLAAGWHGFLDQLDGHLDGLPVAKDEGEAMWKRRHDPYLEKLEAAIR
jgi:uncharacterized protein YndB with AHSA1/START domain